MKMVDLAIGSGGKINRWSNGFFEESAKLAGNKFNSDDYITIGQFRIKKRQYEENKEKFDKYMSGLVIK